MIRGGRAFREARACVRVHHQRVHQSSPATGPTRSRGRHVSRERPTATGPTRSSQDQNLLDEPLADALLLRVGRLEAVLERVADLLHGELLLLRIELVEQ